LELFNPDQSQKDQSKPPHRSTPRGGFSILMRTAIFSARFAELESIRQFVNHAAIDAGMDETGLCAIEMAVDEACSNIIEHAYAGMPAGDIECTCENDEHNLVIVLRDHGQSFDITKVPDPDLSNVLEDRKVGGLGVYLIHQLMDEVRYERMGEAGNILTLVRRLKSEL
jgi:serine/threonine-protein kinase RsbW